MNECLQSKQSPRTFQRTAFGLRHAVATVWHSDLLTAVAVGVGFWLAMMAILAGLLVL